MSVWYIKLEEIGSTILHSHTHTHIYIYILNINHILNDICDSSTKRFIIFIFTSAGVVVFFFTRWLPHYNHRLPNISQQCFMHPFFSASNWTHYEFVSTKMESWVAYFWLVICSRSSSSLYAVLLIPGLRLQRLAFITVLLRLDIST